MPDLDSTQQIAALILSAGGIVTLGWKLFDTISKAFERKMLREGQILFTYLHLAPVPDLARGLAASGATCIAYETVTDSQGGLPLLAPMSQVAGRMSIQAGAHCLESAQGGAGVLLGGVPGVAPGKVVVIGGGVVYGVLKAAIGLRLSEEEEYDGADL